MGNMFSMYQPTHADRTPKDLGNTILANAEGVLTCIQFLDGYIDGSSILAFSQTSQTARRITSETLKKCLLSAIVCGNEKVARQIITSHPAFLLDSSAIVKDLSGKEFKNITPLQAAICAGDVGMVKMIKEVLHHKQQAGITLNFEPELEIQRQFTAIYPNGDIDLVVAEQKVKAQEFYDAKLKDIFTTINTATEVQIRFELVTPGKHNKDSQLNIALHHFREQFTATSNQELIFNPFYFLNAFELYYRKFENFNQFYPQDWHTRDLFWRQVICYIHRHLPACYLQAFAQGINFVVDRGKKLKRDFSFYHDDEHLRRPLIDDLNSLGYKYGGWVTPSLCPNGRGCSGGDCECGGTCARTATKIVEYNKSGFQNLFTPSTGNNSIVPRPGA